ncbi:glycosyl transferase [Deltaproteobacteria bacterium]|nr:glycosyl transferase [Deltaproteobacteria bacterium]
MLSAIVPTKNEALALPALLAALTAEVDEVVVADAGSSDATLEIAARFGARLVTGARGRGPQQNAGAAAATGSILWFVHADTGVPAGAGAALRGAAAPWGCFATTLRSRDPRLRFCGRWMTARARRSGSCSGDMGLWFRRELFTALGGFAPLPALEDLELSDRARAQHPWAVLEPRITTSARRWELEGTTRTMVRLWALRAGYRLGVDPDRLARSYRSTPRRPDPAPLPPEPG